MMDGYSKVAKPTRMILVGISLIFVIGDVSSTIQELGDENWESMLKGEWMVDFIAPWCPACQQLEPIWTDFSNEININVGKVDITKNAGLSGRFGITTLPTIFHVKDAVFRQYRGSKDKEALKHFIIEEQWKKLEPLPFWKSPQSFLMSAYGLLHRMSLWIINLYQMMVSYGIPFWGIVIIFALATILLGSFLGLQIVLVIDTFSRICRSKSETKPGESESETTGSKKGILDDTFSQTRPATESTNDEVEDSNQAEFDEESGSEDEEESCEQSQSDDEEGLRRRRNI